MSLSVTSACPTGIHVSADGIAKQVVVQRVKERKPEGFELLTAAERKTLDAVIQHGMAKSAAKVLGISFKTVEVHMQRSRDKTGFTNSIPMLIAFDRLARGN